MPYRRPSAKPRGLLARLQSKWSKATFAPAPLDQARAGRSLREPSSSRADAPAQGASSTAPVPRLRDFEPLAGAQL